MCGIFGHSIDKVDITRSRESLNTLSHRGPDQWGEFVDTKVYMGHRRLSILDLSENGKQPMSSDNVVITVNGEIYNFQELKNELQQKYNFTSSSDSEVVLYGYIEWGIKGLLERIDGMYVFVIYDKVRNVIFLARDRYGIKPLYYSFFNDTYCWASELKAIVNFYGQQNLQKDNTAIYDYLTYLYIPTPKTLYKDVFKLAPAHFLEFSLIKRTYEITKYWDLSCIEKSCTVEFASDKVKDLINDSVKAQMISDVPLGFFLSGGIDSSIVVATASKFSNQLHTFSIGFDVITHNETQYARQIAELFQTKHAEKILDINDAIHLFVRIKTWYDEPYADTSALPSFLVSEFAKQSATVVLTGDGGDELFGGYDWYERYWEYSKKYIPFLKPLKSVLSGIKRKNRYSLLGKIANQLEYRSLNGLELYTKLLGGLVHYEKNKYREQWNIPADYDDYWYFRKFYKPELGKNKSLQYLDFHTYLHDDIFTKVDRVSMSVALECRVPFMQKDLVEFTFSLPEEIIYHNHLKKGLLKFAYKDILPANILHRNKRGFNIPLSNWQKKFLKEESTSQERILSLFEIND